MLFSGGELDVLHLLKTQGSDVASAQPDEAIRLCLRELCKDKGESAEEHNGEASMTNEKVLNLLSSMISKPETASDGTSSCWHLLTSGASLVMSQAKDTEASVFLAANDSIVTLLAPEVLEDWLKNEPDKANFMVLHKLGVMLNDMQSTTLNSQVAIHGTQFESKFFNLLFSTFPYLIYWTLTADPEECENAKRFLDSLCKFGEAGLEATSGTRCDAVFREACLAQIGYITLKQHKHQVAMLARQVCKRILARRDALNLLQQQSESRRLLLRVATACNVASTLPSDALPSLTNRKHVEENGKNQQDLHVCHQSMYDVTENGF